MEDWQVTWIANACLHNYHIYGVQKSYIYSPFPKDPNTASNVRTSWIWMEPPPATLQLYCVFGLNCYWALYRAVMVWCKIVQIERYVCHVDVIVVAGNVNVDLPLQLYVMHTSAFHEFNQRCHNPIPLSIYECKWQVKKKRNMRFINMYSKKHKNARKKNGEHFPCS